MKVHHIIAAFVMLLLLMSSCVEDKYRFETESGRVYQIQPQKYKGLVEVGDTVVIRASERLPYIYGKYRGTVPESWHDVEDDSTITFFVYEKAIRLD